MNIALRQPPIFLGGQGCLSLEEKELSRVRPVAISLMWVSRSAGRDRKSVGGEAERACERMVALARATEKWATERVCG